MISTTDTKGRNIYAAYEAIRSLIVAGQLGPGSRLVERDLAEYLNLSRSPVRSALLLLREEGYVISRGGERARLVVAPLTRADARELYRILGFLDGESARRAAMLDETTRQAVAANLRRTSRQLDEVAARVPFDARQFFDRDLEFHHHYIERTNTPRMLALYRALRPQADRYRLFYSSGDHVGSLVQVSGEHEAIVSAIEDGDPEGAERAALYNWQRAADRVCAIMEIAGERGAL